MNDLIKVIILGIVEGLTEFIPVSSTAHLILMGHWLSFKAAHVSTFEIAIQLGAIMAVVVHYWPFFRQFLKPKKWVEKDIFVLFIAIFPVMIVGLFAYHYIKLYLFSPQTVIVALFVGGIAMVVTEIVVKNKAKITKVEDIGVKQALIVGLCQCTALWPGMSRSGATIVGGLIAGMNHKVAAEFSFIISVPVMIVAVGYDLIKSAAVLTPIAVFHISVGFMVSFIVAYLAIVGFLKALSRWHLRPFAVYRILLSIVLIFSVIL